MKIKIQMTQKEILLIDDDSMMNFLQKKMLSHYFPVKNINVFENANDALLLMEKSSESSFLIFLDLNMPGMNGWKFMQQLKMKKLFHLSTIIILTSSIDYQDQQDALSIENVVEYISKPLTKEKINKVLALDDVKPFL